MLYAILTKFVVNCGVTLWWARQGIWPMAVMFAGMAICDLGSLWVCLTAKF